MKKREKCQSCIWAFICVMLLLTGCGKDEAVVEQQGEVPVAEQTKEEAVIEKETEEPEVITDEIQETEAETLAADITKTIKEAYGNDDITLLTKEVNDISVVIPGNELAEEEINAFFKARNEAWEDTVELYVEVVEDAYYEWEEDDDEEEWETYAIGREYELKRLDEQMLCVVENTFVKTGGEKTNYVRVAYNFDTWTGKRLSLEEAASHLDEIRTESLAYIGELLQEEEYEDILKDNYTGYLEDILTDSTWYTDEKGMYVICNEDIIAPARAGIMEFFLPYDEVDVIDEVYLPEEESD